MDYYSNLALMSTRASVSNDNEGNERFDSARNHIYNWTCPSTMNIDKPIDLEFITSFEGSDAAIHWRLYYLTMIPTFHEMCLLPSLEKMANCLDDHNYNEVCWIANRIQDATCYVGASRIYFICGIMFHCLHSSDFQPIHDYYPILVEEAFEYIKESNKNLINNCPIEYYEVDLLKHDTII